MLDRVAAKAAGYTDAEIDAFLADQPAGAGPAAGKPLQVTIGGDFDVKGAKAAGYSEREIADYLRGSAGDIPEDVTTIDVPPSEVAEPETTAGGVFGAVGRGLAPAALGAGLGFMTGAGPPGALAGAALTTLGPIVGDPLVEGVNKLLGTDFSTPTEALNNLLTAAGVPEPETATERVIQSAAGGVGGAGGAIGLGRTLASSARPLAAAVGDVLAAQPVAQLVGGGTGAAGSQMAAEAGGGPMAQLASGLAFGTLGGVAAPRPRAPLPAIVQEAREANIPLMTSDVLPPRTFAGRTAQATGERIPIAGTGPVREAQQQARIDAVRDIVNDYSATNIDALPEQIVTDLAQRRSAAIQQYTGSKNEVINRLASAGQVPMQATMQRIGSQIADLRSRRTAEGDEAAAALEQIMNDIQGRNLFELEAYRKDVLSNVFRNDPANQISPGARDVGEKALRAIYDPVRQDMGDFIRQNGQRRDYDRWTVANRRLSEEANELQKQSLKRVLKTGDATPEAVQSLLFSSKPSDVAALYRNLSPQGRAIARQAIIARAAARATGAGEEVVSPTRFANEIRKLGQSVGVFFNGDDLIRLQGLTRVLNATRRAGEAGAFPTTGAQAFLPTAAVGGIGAFGGGLEGFLTAMAAAGSIGGAARLYESPAVRNLLLQASRTEDPQRLQEIAKRIAAIEAAGVEEPRDEQPVGMYNGGLMELARKYR
jgi:hypothetical protein